MNDFENRFQGIARLYGREGLSRLRRCHVCVVGIGGVGTWSVEALARSGVGRLTLIDLDEVCVTNINRQLHSLEGTIGRSKVEVMAERVKGIAPDCQVRGVQEFFTATTGERLLDEAMSAFPQDTAAPLLLVDAIDSVSNKSLLVSMCVARRIPVVCCGAAGGRRDGTRVRMADLADVSHDRLLAEVRRRLRREHGFPPAGRKMRIPCVYSTEEPVIPLPDEAACADGPAEAGPGAPRRLNCDWGLGSASFVTGAFGLAAAGWVVAQVTASAYGTADAR
jgi:tRNA A37 threonylcarbamoyladenosine dehydratase